MSSRAIILGGTGAIGVATAERLLAAGWEVDLTGRTPKHVPAQLRTAGARFHAIGRDDTDAISRLLGDGADLLVDLLAYSADDVEPLVPLWADVASTVVVSGRAVYVDEAGNHINSEQPPKFPVPIPESNPTLHPLPPGGDPFTREGYGPGKVAVEIVALGSGHPVTVLRPSKVHGPWARNPRTASIVERMLTSEPHLDIAHRGATVDHLTASVNVAALIEVVASKPGSRILNIADPDPIPAAEVIEAIAEAVEWGGTVNLLDPDEEGGGHPWQCANPIVLDTTAARDLGYVPVGTARELIKDEVRWVLERRA